jgi:dTDP-4-dehydrorhamnose reductase
MRSLILGGAGMLGHKLYQELSQRGETFAAVRKPFNAYAGLRLFGPASVIECVDVTQPRDIDRAFAAARPDVVFNAVGIIKQLKTVQDPIAAITINSLLPHRLDRLCAAHGARLIHVSTDCVFSGERGGYTEEDIPDPQDLYGRSKLLGETATENSLTLRTSMIGREIGTQSGLVEWFLSQRGGAVKGYKKAIYTGFTTIQLARIMADIAYNHPQLNGLWHASSELINKFNLLNLVNTAYKTEVHIEPDDSFSCDRSLNSDRFREMTGFQPASWPALIEEMAADPTPYDQWRAR